MTISRSDFDDAYRRHAPGAFRRARRMLGSDADAHEVVHDLFLALWERPERFNGSSTLSTFLYAAVTNACLNRIRNQQSRTRLARQHFADRSLAVAAVSEQPEHASLLRSTLEQMPLPLAQVAVYYYLDELTHRDIARILGCSHRHVGDLLERVAQWVKEEETRTCAV